MGEDNNIQNQENDLTRLLKAIEDFTNGNFNQIDTDSFDEPSVGETFNRMVDSVMGRNNHFLMRINDAMIRIGNSSSVKNMIEQLESQREPLKVLEMSKDEFGPAFEQIEEMDVEILALSRQIYNSIEPCNCELQTCYSMIELYNEKTDGVISKITDVKKEIEENTGINTGDKEDILQKLDELQTECVDTGENLKRIQSSIKREAETFENLSGGVSTITDKVNRIYLEIEGRLNHIEAFLNSVDSIANNYEMLSVNSYSAGRHLYRISRDIDNARNDMFRQNTTPTVHDALKVFAVDHLTLTWRLYNNIVEFEQLKITQVNNPDKCKFGLWCHSQTDPIIVDSDSFKHAMEAHYELHNHAVACFIAKESSDLPEAIDEFLQALVALEEYHAALDELHEHLRRNGITKETEVWKFVG